MAGKVALVQAAPPDVRFTGTGRVSFVTRPEDAGITASPGLLPSRSVAPVRVAPTPVRVVRDAAPEGSDVEDTMWARTVSQREAADEMIAGRMVAPAQVPSLPRPQSVGDVARTLHHQVAAPSTVDLSGLPTAFTLHIERKDDGWWKITAPEVHVGLFIAQRDLLAGLAGAPGALAQIVRLDGVVPTPRRKKGKTAPMRFVEAEPEPMDCGVPELDDLMAELNVATAPAPKRKRQSQRKANANT